MVARISVFTSEVPKVLTKRYSIVDGKVNKTVSANMSSGKAQVLEVKDVRSMAAILESLKNNQALCYGLPLSAEVGVEYIVVAEVCKTEGTIARTTKDFEFVKNPGVMFLDHDDEMSKDEFIDTIVSVMPELQTVDKIWFPSSSSFIYNGSQRVTGLKGQRLYFLVDNASKIPQLGKSIYQKLWLAGHGRIVIGKAGQLLERSAVDASVWESNKLDFASGASCDLPLRQERGKPVIIEGCRRLLEIARVPMIESKQSFKYQQLVSEAKQPLRKPAEKVQAAHIEERIKKFPAGQRDRLRSIYQVAYKGGSLPGDFEIVVFVDGVEKIVSVSEILNNKEKYDGCKTLDPIEPEYNDYHKTGKLFLNCAEPYLDSKAHGQHKFPLRHIVEKTKNEKIFDEMKQDVADQLAGKITTIPLPWTRLSAGSNALREGTVTILCGASKVGKSLFAMNVIRHIHEMGITWAYLPLEDGTKEWLWRILAIAENTFAMVGDDPESAKLRGEVLHRRGDEIMAYMESVTENPRRQFEMIGGKRTRCKVTPESTLKWVEEQAKNGKRVVFVDPLVQISFGGFSKWDQEELFMQDLCGIAADYKISLVLVSHTRKKNGDDSGELTIEDMQGSAAFGRLCHTSILLGSTHEMEEVNISRPGGEIEKVMSNRTCVIGAARNGAGTRSKIAYAMNPGSPVFHEIGYLAAIKKGKK